MVKAELRLAFDGSAPLAIATDTTWKARPSHITPLGRGTSGSYDGELVEAEKEIADWSAADYDDSGWQPATVHHGEEKSPEFSGKTGLAWISDICSIE